LSRFLRVRNGVARQKMELIHEASTPERLARPLYR
jgi:hypothetical protein